MEVDEALLDYVVEPAVVESPSLESEARKAINAMSQPPQCAICEFVMIKLESELANEKTDQNIEDVVRSVCSKMPNTVTKQCDHLIDEYGKFIIKFLATIPPQEICKKLSLCWKQLQELEELNGECTIP